MTTMAPRKKRKRTLRKKLSQHPATVEYRDRYRTDPDFRAAEIARTRARYVPRPRLDTFTFEGKTFVNVKKCAEILGLKPDQLRYMIYKRVVPSGTRLNGHQYIFEMSNVLLMKENLIRFLDRPELVTVERFNLRNFKAFLAVNWNNYTPPNRQETESEQT